MQLRKRSGHESCDSVEVMLQIKEEGNKIPRDDKRSGDVYIILCMNLRTNRWRFSNMTLELFLHNLRIHSLWWRVDFWYTWRRGCRTLWRTFTHVDKFLKRNLILVNHRLCVDWDEIFKLIHYVKPHLDHVHNVRQSLPILQWKSS